MLTDWQGRAPQRIADLIGAADALGREIADWFRRRTGEDPFRRFARHFDLVRDVVDEMLRAVRAAAEAVDGTPGEVYAGCRRLDGALTVIRRLFFWYASKYDQRTDLRYAGALAATDELVRSCWTEAFVPLRRQPPAAPLAYVDDRFDAYAIGRVSPPTDLRAPADSVVASFVKELPVPTIALPAATARRVWWAVLAAHETGHHVAAEVPGLAEAARDAVGTAVPADLRTAWRGWSDEVFADAFAVFTVGPAAVWAIDELQHGTPAAPPRPGSKYPPAAVRLALLGEMAAPARENGWPPVATEVSAWLGRPPGDEVGRHAAATPRVAAALARLTLGDRSLRAGVRADDVPPRVAAWAGKLAGPRPRFVGLDTRIAARVAIAAGVHAYRSMATAAAGTLDPGALDGLHERLVQTLRSCGEPGVLAAPAAAGDRAALAGRFAHRLLAEAR